jgi:hypothetical protein
MYDSYSTNACLQANNQSIANWQNYRFAILLNTKNFFCLLTFGLFFVSCQNSQFELTPYHDNTINKSGMYHPPGLVALSSNADTGGHFTLGSSMNHVASVMGTPNRIVKLALSTMWYYDQSNVTFENQKVVEWDNVGNKLKVTMPSSTPEKNFFELGSTQYEVAGVMGAPTSIQNFIYDTRWCYNYSSVTFRDKKVVEWDDASNNLKVRLNDGIAGIDHKSIRPSIYSSYSFAPKSSYNSDGYVDPHYRRSTSVQGYFRKNGTYVSPHFRSGSQVRGSLR